jgi:hypothetical protein
MIVVSSMDWIRVLAMKKGAWANYLAFVQLASIRLWLAARNESTP